MYYIPANTSNTNYKWNVFWIKDYAHDNELMISDQKIQLPLQYPHCNVKK